MEVRRLQFLSLLLALIVNVWCENKMEFIIDKTWNNRKIDSDTPVTITLTGSSDSKNIRVNITAPFFKDPLPDEPPGSQVLGLWNYEVVELFFLNDEDQYLEIEIGPYGHHFVLMFSGERNTIRHSLPLFVITTHNDNQWNGQASIPGQYFPKRVTKFNAYYIHGSTEPRQYWTLNPVDEATTIPDLHDLRFFQSIDLTTISTIGNEDDYTPLWKETLQGIITYDLEVKDDLGTSRKTKVTFQGFQGGVELNFTVPNFSTRSSPFSSFNFAFANPKGEALQLQLFAEESYEVFFRSDKIELNTRNLPMDYRVFVNDEFLFGSALIPPEYFPPNVRKITGFAEFGIGSTRTISFYPAYVSMDGFSVRENKEDYFATAGFDSLVSRNDEYSKLWLDFLGNTEFGAKISDETEAGKFVHNNNAVNSSKFESNMNLLQTKSDAEAMLDEPLSGVNQLGLVNERTATVSSNVLTSRADTRKVDDSTGSPIDESLIIGDEATTNRNNELPFDEGNGRVNDSEGSLVNTDAYTDVTTFAVSEVSESVKEIVPNLILAASNETVNDQPNKELLENISIIAPVISNSTTSPVRPSELTSIILNLTVSDSKDDNQTPDVSMKNEEPMEIAINSLDKKHAMKMSEEEKYELDVTFDKEMLQTTTTTMEGTLVEGGKIKDRLQDQPPNAPTSIQEAKRESTEANTTIDQSAEFEKKVSLETTNAQSVSFSLDDKTMEEPIITKEFWTTTQEKDFTEEVIDKEVKEIKVGDKIHTDDDELEDTKQEKSDYSVEESTDASPNIKNETSNSKQELKDQDDKYSRPITFKLSLISGETQVEKDEKDVEKSKKEDEKQEVKLPSPYDTQEDQGENAEEQEASRKNKVGEEIASPDKNVTFPNEKSKRKEETSQDKELVKPETPDKITEENLPDAQNSENDKEFKFDGDSILDILSTISESENDVSSDPNSLNDILNYENDLLPPPHPICFTPGLVPDPFRCQLFYECVLENGEWQVYNWRCQRGYYYDNDKVACLRGYC